MGGTLTRRAMLRVLGAAATLPACTSSDSEGSGTGFFTPAERRALTALSNVVIPVEPGSLGAPDLTPARYVERLCTAFDVDPPAIFADGPFSGRQPFSWGPKPENDFVRWTPLDRVTTKAWRIKIYGSKAEGAINDGLVPEVIGLRDRIKSGLRDAMAGKEPLETLSLDQVRDVFDSLDKDLQSTLVDLFTEAAFGAPEYGGNLGLGGWSLANFEGDSQPLGYSIFDPQTGTYRDRFDAPMAGPSNAPDPDPLDDGTRAILSQVVAFAGGKEFP